MSFTVVFNMTRTYKRKPGARNYRNYSEQTLEQALEKLSRGKKFSNISKEFNIPARTLRYKIKGAHSKVVGGRQKLTTDEELETVSNLLLCAEYGMSLDQWDIKLFVQTYLNKMGKKVPAFKDNLPGYDWVSSFLTRHKNLSMRNCQNIKRSRAKLSQETVKDYFKNLEGSLDGVPPPPPPPPPSHPQLRRNEFE